MYGGDFHINRALGIGIQKEQTKYLHIGYNESPEEFMNTQEIRKIEELKTNKDGKIRIEAGNDVWLKSDDAKQRRKVYLRGFKEYLSKKEWLNS